MCGPLLAFVFLSVIGCGDDDFVYASVGLILLSININTKYVPLPRHQFIVFNAPHL